MASLALIAIVLTLFAVWGVTTREKHESLRQGAVLGAVMGVLALAIAVLLQEAGCRFRDLVPPGLL